MDQYPVSWKESAKVVKYRETAAGELAGLSLTKTDLTISTYDNIVSVIRNTYLYGNTRIDCITRAIANTPKQSDIEEKTTKSITITRSDYLQNAVTGRERKIIILTDGSPTETSTRIGGDEFSALTAHYAIDDLRSLKKDGVKIYVLGYSNLLDASKGLQTLPAKPTEALLANNFMNLISSKYPNSDAYDWISETNTTHYTPNAADTSETFYMSDDDAGENLAEHFATILDKASPEIVSANDGSLYLHDEITREFMVDKDIKVTISAAPYLGNNTYGTPVKMGEHTIGPNIAAQTFTGKGYSLIWKPVVNTDRSSLTVKWSDSKYAFLREDEMATGGSYPDYKRGYKIMVEIPLEVNRDNTVGGNKIPTNQNTSGLYLANKGDTSMGSKKITYTVPVANVKVKFDQSVHDYFMELPELVSISNSDTATQQTKEKQILFDLFSFDLAAANAAGKSRLDYVNVNLTLADGSTTLYKKTAAKSATKFTETTTLPAEGLDLTTDRTYSFSFNLTQANTGTDSVGHPGYADILVNESPNYYAPKFMVVDFDAVGSVNMDKEADTERLGFSATNGSYDSATGHVKFDFRETYGSEEARKMMNGWVTIPYTFDSINVPKDGVDIRSRQVYVLPGNVISYDDTLFGFWEDGALDTTATAPTAGKWVRMGTYGNDEQLPKNAQVHGYDANFATTGDYHGASTVARVSTKKPEVAPIVFEFFGTGFELLSRTAPDSGTVIVEIFKAKADGTYGAVADTGYLVDTYLASKTLYQIPIVQFLSGETTPAKYKVHVIPVYDMIFDHGKKGFTPITEEQARAIAGFDETVDFHFIPSGSVAPATRGTYEPAGAYNVYVDGCRVYNTLAKDTQGIRDYVYSLAGEQDANILNINDQIVDVTAKVDWTNTSEISGMLFIEAPQADDSDVGGDTGSDETITTSGHGYCLGMDGSLYEEKDPTDSNKFYVRTPKLEYITHGEYGTRIYYRLSPKGRAVFYCTDSNGAEVQLTKAEIRKYVGNGEEIVYYSGAYKAIGPANEVYLSSGQGVAFMVNAANAKVFMSMKTVDGKAVTVQAYNGTAFETISGLADYCSDTEMYFDLTDYVVDGMVMIKNGGSGMLSLCNLKTASADGSLRPIINARMVRKALHAFSMEAELPVVDEGVQIRHSLNLQSDISVNLMVPVSVLEGYDRYVMECTVAGKTFLPEAVVKGDYVYFVVDGIMATQMNENIHSVLYLIKGDREYVSLEDDYSVACYAYSVLNKDAADNIKTLCANLLRYGSLAQVFKGYQTDALADEEMTEVHKSYLTDMDTVAFGNNNRLLGDVTEPTVPWFGKTMVLDSKVTMVYVVNLKDYEGAIEDLTLRVSYENVDGDRIDTVLDNIQVHDEAMGLYSFKLDSLLAAELRTVVTAAVYAGEVQVSETLCYSADTYGKGKTGTLAELCKALFAYSDSARAFFAG